MPRVPFDPQVQGIRGPGAFFPQPRGTVAGGGLEAVGDALNTFVQSLNENRSPTEGRKAFFDDSIELIKREQELDQQAFESPQARVQAKIQLYEAFAQEKRPQRESQLNDAGFALWDNQMLNFLFGRANRAATQAGKEHTQNQEEAFTTAQEQITRDFIGAATSDERSEAVIRAQDLVRENTGLLFTENEAPQITQSLLRDMAVRRALRDASTNPRGTLRRLAAGAQFVKVPKVTVIGGEVVVGSVEQGDVTDLLPEEVRAIRQEATQALTAQNGLQSLQTQEAEAEQQSLEQQFTRSFLFDLAKAQTPDAFATVEQRLAQAIEGGTLQDPQAIRRLQTDIRTAKNQILQGNTFDSREEFNEILAEISTKQHNAQSAIAVMSDVLKNPQLSPNQKTQLIQNLEDRVQNGLSDQERAAIELIDGSLEVTGPGAQFFNNNEQLALKRAKASFRLKVERQRAAISSGETSFIRIATEVIREEAGLLKGRIKRKKEGLKERLKQRILTWNRSTLQNTHNSIQDVILGEMANFPERRDEKLLELQLLFEAEQAGIDVNQPMNEQQLDQFFESIADVEGDPFAEEAR